MMGSTYVDPKTVLDNIKSTTCKFFKFRMEGGEVDKNYVFCRLCLDGGNEGKRGQIKYCGGTTNMTNHLKACHKEEAKSLVKEEGPKQSILHHFVIFLRFEFIIYGKLPFEYTYGFLERIND